MRPADQTIRKSTMAKEMALKASAAIRWTDPITPSQILRLIRSEPDTRKALELFDSATASGHRHDPAAFSLILSRLSAANLFHPAESLVDRVLPALTHPPPESAFLPLLRAYGRAHKPLEALRLFHRLRDRFNVTPTSKSYTCLLAVLVAENQLKLAKMVYNQMKEADIPPTVASYNVLIKALCNNAVTIDVAVRVFRRMETGNCVPDPCTYNTLIVGLCKNGRLDDARKLFDEMRERSILPTVVTFTSLINGLCKSGRLEEALALFDEMGQEAIKPNVVTYSCLLDGLCKGGKAMKAIRLLDRMVADRCPPNAITYSALISGLCGEGRVREAAQVLDRMRLQGKKPDAGLYAKIIDGFACSGLMNEAANYLDEMVLSGVVPNRVTWSLHVRINNLVLRGLCSKGELSRGFQLYQSMRTRGISPEPESFHLLAGCYCMKRDTHKAARIVDEMLAEGCVPEEDTWSIIMDGFWDRKSVRDAVELVMRELFAEHLGTQVECQ